MQLIVNGIKETGMGATLADLVAAKKLSKESLVVELNGLIIKEEHWAHATLKDGDQVELLNFVGGG